MGKAAGNLAKKKKKTQCSRLISRCSCSALKELKCRAPNVHCQLQKDCTENNVFSGNQPEMWNVGCKLKIPFHMFYREIIFKNH